MYIYLYFHFAVMFRMYDTDKNGYLDQVFCFLNPPPDDHDDNYIKWQRGVCLCVCPFPVICTKICVCVYVCVSVCLFVCLLGLLCSFHGVCTSVCLAVTKNEHFRNSMTFCQYIKYDLKMYPLELYPGSTIQVAKDPEYLNFPKLSAYHFMDYYSK